MLDASFVSKDVQTDDRSPSGCQHVSNFIIQTCRVRDPIACLPSKAGGPAVNRDVRETFADNVSSLLE